MKTDPEYAEEMKKQEEERAAMKQIKHSEIEEH
jgi:hypothetical protein